MQDLQSGIDEKTSGDGILQGTAEWKALRLGKVTASRIADVMARTKSGYGASRGNYLTELVLERITGVAAEHFINDAMAHGTENEPLARSMYEFMTDNSVDQIPFVDHPSIGMSGCSPDGLVGDSGLIEIKCPSSKTHMATLLGASIEEKYMKQMQFQMACTGRLWCDFVSFDPRMAGDMQIHIQRVPRDGVMIVEIEREVSAFLSEVDATVAKLIAMYRLSLIHI
jgi:putative phage-type endonuclease